MSTFEELVTNLWSLWISRNKYLHSFEEVDVVDPNLWEEQLSVRWQSIKEVYTHTSTNTELRCVYLIRHYLHAYFIQGKVIRLSHLLSEGEKRSEFSQICVLHRFTEGSTRHTAQPHYAACALTCSWAASLWSPGRMRGSISTGRCATLSWDISETTAGNMEGHSQWKHEQMFFIFDDDTTTNLHCFFDLS